MNGNSAPKAANVIADDIRKRVALGEFGEGDALPNETALMQQYNVSRPTVRGALRILESESLLSVKMGPGGGPRVHIPDAGALAKLFSMQLQLSSTSVGDVFAARTIIEPAAARQLASRPSAEVVRELRELHRQEMALAGEPLRFATAAAEFHERVVELAGNRTLGLVARLLGHLVAEHNQSTMMRHRRPDRVASKGLHEHAQLIHHIEAGDADAAERAWRQHMVMATAATLRVNGIGVIPGSRPWPEREP